MVAHRAIPSLRDRPPPHRNHLVYVTDSPVWKFARQTMRGIMHVYVNLFGSESLRRLLGPHYLNDFFELYVIDTMRSPQHFATFMRLFEEMDSWSIYHLLPRIQHPILVVAGIWDPLTPAYHAFEMAEALPNAKLVVSYASSHLTLLEQPGLCMRHIKDFVQKKTPTIRFRRRSDIMFVK